MLLSGINLEEQVDNSLSGTVKELVLSPEDLDMASVHQAELKTNTYLVYLFAFPTL